MKSTLLATSALTTAAERQPGAGWPLWPRTLGAAGATALVAAASLMALAQPAWSSARADFLPVAADATEILGDEGGDEFGEVGENGDYLVPPETGERGDIGEQGEYSDGEYGERGEAGWNRPRDDNEGESDDLLEGLGSGGQGSTPGPGGGSPLLEGLGEGGDGGSSSGSGGLLD